MQCNMYNDMTYNVVQISWSSLYFALSKGSKENEPIWYIQNEDVNLHFLNEIPVLDLNGMIFHHKNNSNYSVVLKVVIDNAIFI